MNSTDPARMKNSPVFHNAVFTSLRSASTALSIPAGATTQTADKMPMMVISLSRYSRYCFASILVYRAASAHWEAETFYLPLCLPPILKDQIDRKRESNAPVLLRAAVMKLWHERRASCGTASPSQFIGDPAVGGRVCAERLEAECVLPPARSRAEHSASLSEETRGSWERRCWRRCSGRSGAKRGESVTGTGYEQCSGGRSQFEAKNRSGQGF